MTVLITGVAGFIGYHVAQALLKEGRRVVGIDNLNSYYLPHLKRMRLEQLEVSGNINYQFYNGDITDPQMMRSLSAEQGQQITAVIHLAAQPGVRYSIDHPLEYVHSNLHGHVAVLECCRHLNSLRHLIYASSSSVYGANSVLPFTINDYTSKPLSLYAATKISNEVMSYSYSHLYRIPMTGLRFFTVYGPWGRPDMAVYSFAKAIYEERPLTLFQGGELKRDFTYIDDIVDGILQAESQPPVDRYNIPPHRVYNLGHHRNERVITVVALLEEALGEKAIIFSEPMQSGDMQETLADIKESTRDLHFYPKITLKEGIPRFVEWFKAYYPSLHGMEYCNTSYNIEEQGSV